ncbi:hypothetical protein Val02_67670 [Virgisporangium aliadipatigenens]|uniref:FHA domain-containing protein n=1 Tax=Virgisporangium aliadipatigenens TaxID=741659 RepID=A0A8J3YU70_9ACTN|nr:FHA domain-containing protein [Virgisporangium aliadipatigenens]GIJ49881.1 hypothetical protein Val02_67670 [Virgisporangium aliadipatigenens]
MVRCPEGHESETADFCDVCGAQIGAAVPAAAAVPSAAAGPASASASASDERCPLCGTPRDGRFCENDGYDFLLRAGGAVETPGPPAGGPDVPDGPGGPGLHEPHAPSTVDGTGTGSGGGNNGDSGWRLIVTADAEHHRRMVALAGPEETAGYPFPAFLPARTFAVGGAQTLIGRRSRSRGLNPEVDLSGPPEDPGVSHAQAMVLVQPDGSVAVVDLDSSNGTYVNGAIEAIPPMTPVPLSAGDRIHVGLWTTLTLTDG